MLLRVIISAICCVVLLTPGSGCMTSTFTQTGDAQPARPHDCDFDIFTIPHDDFVEIGTIDINEHGPTNLTWVKNLIRSKVCQAGGDAVVAWANGLGVYVKATVLKRIDSSAPATRPLDRQPEPCHGCEYDTQCKGDRICVAGKCTSP